MSHARLIAIMLAAVVLSAVVGLGAGISALIYANRVDALVQQRDDDRVAASIASCVETNVRIQKERDALKSSLLALVPAGTELTSEQQARVDAYGVVVDGKLPYRDCSPEGIAAYLTDPPNDPATDLTYPSP